MKVTSLGQMANHTAKHLYRMNRAIVHALISAGKIAAEQADQSGLAVSQITWSATV